MRGSLRRATASGYGRTTVVAFASMALLAGAWGSASGAEAPPAAAFTNGTAKATAVVSRVAPGVGALELGISGGVAVSEIKNTVAQSQAKTLDLGLLGSTLTAESCGRPATISPASLPQPVTVDSRKGAASASADQVPIAGTTLGAGHKEAHASPEPPASSAIATLVGASVPGLITVDGGKAEATTNVIKGQAREAHARVSVGLDIAGLVKLSGLTWDAFHRTGKDPRATASFDIGTGSLLGVPIPLESLTQVEALINQTLAFTGISLTFPRVERFTTPADLIRITPLRIVLQDSPAGKAGLGPILTLTRAQREQLFTQLASTICDAAAALLVGDISLDVASGTGFISIEIGGAEATTGDLVLDSPFGAIGATPPEAFPSVLPPAIVPPSLPNLAVSGGPLGSTAQRTSSIGPLVDRCQSSHPFEHTACSKGALLAVGLVGLAATAAVGGLDWRHQRRRRARLAAAAGGPAT